MITNNCPDKHDVPMCDYKVYEKQSEPSERVHIHDFHEIFMLLEGNVKYFAEGTIFPLAPKELVVIRSGLTHGKTISDSPYVKCFVIFLTHDFFIKNNCQEYEKIFCSQKNSEYKINAEICENSGFFDAYTRLREYTNNFSDTTNAIARSIIIEMLHILNNNANFSTSYISNNQVNKILNFINDNFAEKITLDDISHATFISKYHICKLFKKYVGYTVNQYINIKRIEKVKVLVAQGQTITSACVEAGFSDYSAFYKAFLRINHVPPGEIMKAKE